MSFPMKNGGSFHSYVAVYQRVGQNHAHLDHERLTVKQGIHVSSRTL